jgi:hypothetical protein
MSTSDPPPWLKRLRELRHEFQRWADKSPALRHLIIQPLTPKMRMPGRLAAQIGANCNVVRFCDVWSWHDSFPEIAYLYGPAVEVAAFEGLARKACLSVPWPESPPCGEEGDHWLGYVYAALRKEFPSCFELDNVLQVVGGKEGREFFFTFSPEQEAEAKGQQFAALPRFRQTSLRIDPFEASAVAIDAMTGANAIRSILDTEARRLRARPLWPTGVQDAEPAPAPVPEHRQADSPADGRPLARARHSKDFRSVHWFGTDYTFTEGQAAVVAILWEAWENGTPDVGHRYLLATAKLSNDRLPDVFKEKGMSHPAWGTMIQSNVGSKGTARLCPPETSVP